MSCHFIWIIREFPHASCETNEERRRTSDADDNSIQHDESGLMLHQLRQRGRGCGHDVDVVHFRHSVIEQEVVDTT